MKPPITFEAEILKHDNLDASYIVFPFDVLSIFGKKGQVKVKVLFDEKIEHRGSLSKYRSPFHWLGINKELRAKIGKSFGDIVKIELWEDQEERIIEIPEDVQPLFDENPKAFEIYQKLSFTHRKEYMRWVTDAKKPETRASRKSKLIEMILAGKKGI